MNRRKPSTVARIRAVGGIVVACVQTKGGAGESTLAYNLAHEYAERGASVLLIETDIQRTLIDAAEARTMPPKLTVMPYPHLSIYEDLPQLAAGYDVVVLDGQGHNHAITRAVVLAATYHQHGVILVPVMASLADVRATRRDMVPMLIEAADYVWWQLRVRSVLMRYDPRERITAMARDALAAPPTETEPQLQLVASRADIQHRTIYAHTLATGHAVCELEPGGAAAQEVAALATEAATLALSEPEQKVNR